MTRFSIDKWGLSLSSTVKEKLGFELKLNSNRKMGFELKLNSNRKMGFEFGCAFSHDKYCWNNFFWF